MQIQIPELEFSPWMRWDERRNFDGIKYPGVYAIAITTSDLSGRLFSYDHTIYIGMSNSPKGLEQRWNHFADGIRDGSHHSGAKRIYKAKKCLSWQEWDESVYVSAMSVPCKPSKLDYDDRISMGIVAFLEYYAFAEFHRHTGQLRPMYNKK
ncbi:MAG: hypothetical protein J0M07_27605 [Anaerolineae bacterium]|nr:hypothetical protein [Anaerolineae bacterium]